MSAELRSHGVKERSVLARRDLEICFAVAGNENGLVRRIGAGQSHDTIALTGTAWLSPAGVGDDVLAITAPLPKAMHLCLPIALFGRLGDDFALPPAPAHSIRYASVRDGVISAIALSLLAEMTNETSVGRMYAETASLMLAAHIVFKYCDGGSFAFRESASDQLDQLRIRRVLDFISAHLADEIALSQLAQVAGLSTYHFARMFTQSVGLSPHRYVGRLRLENAMTEIAAGKLSLAQIAFNAGFSSQASFTRAFRRVTRLTPGEYRRSRR